MFCEPVNATLPSMMCPSATRAVPVMASSGCGRVVAGDQNPPAGCGSHSSSRCTGLARGPVPECPMAERPSRPGTAGATRSAG